MQYSWGNLLWKTMNKLNSNNQTSKRTRTNRALGYALPIVVFSSLVVGTGRWFARFNQVPANNQVASLVQPPTAANQEKLAVYPNMAVTLAPAKMRIKGKIGNRFQCQE